MTLRPVISPVTSSDLLLWSQSQKVLPWERDSWVKRRERGRTDCLLGDAGKTHANQPNRALIYKVNKTVPQNISEEFRGATATKRQNSTNNEFIGRRGDTVEDPQSFKSQLIHRNESVSVCVLYSYRSSHSSSKTSSNCNNIHNNRSISSSNCYSSIGNMSNSSSIRRSSSSSVCPETTPCSSFSFHLHQRQLQPLLAAN